MLNALTAADLDALDPAALKTLLLAQQAAHAALIESYATQLQSHTVRLDSRASEIERLKLLVEELQRLVFGTKSEKVLRHIEQLELQLDDLQVATAAGLHHLTGSTGKLASAKPFRRPLPEHLPREIHTHMSDHEACPDCGGRLRELGGDARVCAGFVQGHP